jgi:uncharacterized protein YbjQ (UPF0145 family)
MYFFRLLNLFFKYFKNKKMNDSVFITTSNALDGYRVTKQLGLVRGITVRSRSLLGNIAGGFMTLFGGKSVIYTELCERTREDALQLMIEHGRNLGCNAIINMRYDANEVLNGVTEVLAYGTAVVVERI